MKFSSDAWRDVAKGAAILELGELGDIENNERRTQALHELHQEWHGRLEKHVEEFFQLNQRLGIVEYDIGKAQKRVSAFWRKKGGPFKDRLLLSAGAPDYFRAAQARWMRAQASTRASFEVA